MVQKYIAAILVFTVLGLTPPAFAGDFVNSKLLPKRFPASNLTSSALANPQIVPSRTTFGNLAGSVALAPPQSGGASQAKSGGLTTKGKVFTIVGIGLMAEGALSGAYGAAILSDPCAGYRSGSCTSNYNTVRATYFGICAASVVVGAIFLIKGLHSRE
jgi:hypothetical protein